MLGAIIVVLLVVAYYSVADPYGRNEAIVLHANDLQLMLGEGDLSEDGLVIKRLTAGGGAYINIPIAGLETSENSKPLSAGQSSPMIGMRPSTTCCAMAIKTAMPVST